MDCIFCKIMAGEIPSYKIYENDEILAFLDIMPINPGHTLVITKAHYADLLATPEELIYQVVKAIKKITPAILKGVGASDFNLGLNNGPLAGQAVNHFHYHIMPRFKDDGRELWRGKKYGAGEAEEIVSKIKENL